MLKIIVIYNTNYLSWRSTTTDIWGHPQWHTSYTTIKSQRGDTEFYLLQCQVQHVESWQLSPKRLIKQVPELRQSEFCVDAAQNRSNVRCVFGQPTQFPETWKVWPSIYVEVDSQLFHLTISHDDKTEGIRGKQLYSIDTVVWSRQTDSLSGECFIAVKKRVFFFSMTYVELVFNAV